MAPRLLYLIFLRLVGLHRTTDHSLQRHPCEPDPAPLNPTRSTASLYDGETRLDGVIHE